MVEIAFVVENQSVYNVESIICPTYNTTAVLSTLALNGNINQTVFDDSTAITDTNQATMGSVTLYAAVDGNVSVTADDTTAVPTGNTTGELVAGVDGTLNFQVLDYSVNTYVAEETCTLLIEGHVVVNGVTVTFKDTLIILTVTTDSVILGALVDVSYQNSIGIGVLAIYDFCKFLQVIC